MDQFNVVGDLEGRFLTLQALLAQMPPAELISLGDVNDRGPNTKDTIEFLMKNGRTVASNHGHFMTTEYRERLNPHVVPRYYEPGLWPECNGGMATMRSYNMEPFFQSTLSSRMRDIPEEHIQFLENCPMYIESDHFIMSHAPARQSGTLEEMSNFGFGFYQRYGVDWNSENSFLWNRFVPNRPNPELKGKINLFGHNSNNAVKVFSAEFPQSKKVHTTEELHELLAKREEYPIWAIGLDTSGGQFLTGLHTPTMTLYKQEFID
jgi:hypothetical protein